MIGMSENVISIAEWKAKHQRITDQPNPVVWTYYEVVRDPSGGWRLELIDRKPKLELD
jgi:hypothetical protein